MKLKRCFWQAGKGLLPLTGSEGIAHFLMFMRWLGIFYFWKPLHYLFSAEPLNTRLGIMQFPSEPSSEPPSEPPSEDTTPSPSYKLKVGIYWSLEPKQLTAEAKQQGHGPPAVLVNSWYLQPDHVLVESGPRHNSDGADKDYHHAKMVDRIFRQIDAVWWDPDGTISDPNHTSKSTFQGWSDAETASSKCQEVASQLNKTLKDIDIVTIGEGPDIFIYPASSKEFDQVNELCAITQERLGTLVLSTNPGKKSFTCHLNWSCEATLRKKRLDKLKSVCNDLSTLSHGALTTDGDSGEPTDYLEEWAMERDCAVMAVQKDCVLLPFLEHCNREANTEE